MESSVASQIGRQIYTAKLTELYEGDIDVNSELFEINIFNSTLHIAPGKSIRDDDLVYFYVYAIRDERVLANLGVYELNTDEQKTIYDISTFENLLLFDYYYTHPSKIKEFEITGKNNIFDYILTHLEFDKEKSIKLYYELLTFIKQFKDTPEFQEDYKLYKKINTVLSKDIREKGIDKEKIDQLKEKCKTDIKLFKLTLAVLEPFLNVQFSFVDNGENVSNSRSKTPPQKFTPTQYIIVSVDQSFISTATTKESIAQSQSEVALDEPVEPEMLGSELPVPELPVPELTVPGSEALSLDQPAVSKTGTLSVSQVDPEPSVSLPKSRPKLTLNTLPVPRVKSALSTIKESSEAPSGVSVSKPKVKFNSQPDEKSQPKPEAKAESRTESKAESKTKGKSGKSPKLVLESLPPPPPESKAESKAESKTSAKIAVAPGILSQSASRVESKLANSYNSNNDAKPTKSSVTVASKEPEKGLSKPKKSFTTES